MGCACPAQTGGYFYTLFQEYQGELYETYISLRWAAHAGGCYGSGGLRHVQSNRRGHTLPRTVAVAITQSGETADTLKAMKRLRETGCRVIAITNVVGGTASRIANQTIYTKAGPEISVAATKSFMTQLMVLYWLVMSYSKADARRLASLLMELRQMPSKVQQVLDDETKIMECARYLSKYENAFFIGRGINLPVALEGAWKLTEVSYIHADGNAAGEM